MKTRFVLLVLLLLALGACQSGETPTAEPAPTAVAVEPTTIPTEVPTQVPTEVPTQEPTEVPTAVPTEEPTAEPTPLPDPTAVPTPEPPSVDFEGISFEQGGLASAVVPTVIPEQVLSDGPYWATYPTFYEFVFEGYPLEETFHTPRLMVYPARAYAGMNLAAREQINALNALLDGPEGALAEQERLPFMPLFNAAQVFHSQAAWLAFENGRGVRYLTYYSQAVMPVTNQDIFYTFQGLTDDRRHYVSLVLPISTSVLPNQMPNWAGEEWQAFEEEYEAYMEETIAALDALGPDEFLPTLSAIDQLVQSLVVNPTAGATPEGLAVELPTRFGQYLSGETVEVVGTAPKNTAEVAVMLYVGPHVVGEATAAVDGQTGVWQTSLTLPENLIGPGRFVATLGGQTVSHPLTVYPAPGELEAGQPRVVVYRPFTGELLVAGRTLFVNGMVENPIGDRVTIGVLVEDCTRFVARQTFTVPRGEWQGQLILPAELSGPACLTAYTGEHGTAEGYEWLVATAIVSPDDPSAPRLTVAEMLTQPQRGVAWTLIGTAVNPPNNEVTVRFTDVNGAVLVSQTAAVDTFGYWEVSITLPASAPDFVIVTAGFVEDGEPVEYQTGFVVR